MLLSRLLLREGREGWKGGEGGEGRGREGRVVRGKVSWQLKGGRSKAIKG